MFFKRSRCFLLVLWLIGCSIFWALSAQALIDLEWRPPIQDAVTGATVEIQLYAVSDNVSDQSIAAIDVILVWDPLYLDLTGVINNGPYQWLYSGFSNDSGLDGLNDTWLDGDALYSAYSQLGQPAYATSSGLLVATLQFEAVAEVSSSMITVPLQAGQNSRTRVFDGDTPGLDVLGSVDSAVVCIGNFGSIYVSLTCNPATGTVPFHTQLSIGVGSTHADQYRKVAGRIDVLLGNGTSYSNFREGFTTLPPGGLFNKTLNLLIPQLDNVLGYNQFHLIAEDVTPAPYNQPPYAPSGDTSTDSCTVEAVAP